MKGYISSIRRFKLRSVFLRFYSLIFTLVIIMALIFAIYIYRVYISNFASEQRNSQESFLSQVTERMDNSVYFLDKTMASLAGDVQILEAVIIPSAENSKRNFETASLLRQNVDNFDYINKIYLYEDTAKLLYTSSGTVETIEQSAYRTLVQSCIRDHREDLPLESAGNKSSSRVLSYDGQIFLMHQFVPGKDGFLGTLIAEINKDALFSSLQERLSAQDYQLEIYDSYGNLFYQGGIKGEQEPGSLSLTQTSVYTGWDYVLSVPPYASLTLGAYFRLMLPFFIFLLAAGLIFAFLIASQVYTPIYKLLLSIDPVLPEAWKARKPSAMDDAKEAPQASISEMDLLASTYRNLRKNQQESEEFMEQARPELEATLLQDIIMDIWSEDEKAQLQQQLLSLRSTLSVEGKYQSFLIYLPLTETTENLMQYMSFKQIQALITERFSSEWGSIYFLRPQKEEFIFVIQYPEDFSVARIKQIQANLQGQISRELAAFSDGSMLVSGKIYQDLFHVAHSYHEAKEELRKRLYYHTEENAKQGGSPVLSANESYFVSQLQVFQNFLTSGEITLGENQLTQFLKEVCVIEGSMEKKRYWCVQVLDALVEKTLDYQTEEERFRSEEYHRIYQDLERVADQKTLYLFMVKETSGLLEFLKKENNKKQQKLILRAKEYMQQHYSDSNLSIHQIAESVGISDTYLSSIFTQFTGENLISYLNSYRVHMAKELLANSRIIIKDVGFKTGFNTVQNFNRVFKKNTGMTPSDFRKQKLKEKA